MTTKPEVLAMAREAGFIGIDEITQANFERFAALAFAAGRAAEREECAKICDEYRTTDWVAEYPHAITAAANIAHTIRARSAK